MRKIAGCAALVSLAALVTPAAAGPAQAPGRWRSTVSARYSAAAAYDAARGQVVVFGGKQPGTSSGHRDTWTWGTGGWTQRTAFGSGPSARYDAQIAYHEAARQTVLFGGFDDHAYGYKGDTWTWDGSRWTSRPGTQPPVRRYGSMVYDPARRQVVLFGGYGGDGDTPETAASDDYLGDTWTWDGSRWSQRTGPGPSPRRNAHMVYDPTSRRVLLFGGFGAGTPQYRGDTWTWDGKGWTEVQGAGPEPRTGAGIAYDAAARHVVLFGGYTVDDAPLGTRLLPVEKFLADTWTFDGTRWAKRSGAGPSARNGTHLAYDPSRRQTVLFGGDYRAPPIGGIHLTGDRTYLGDTWTWDGKAWTRRATGGPVGRVEASLVYSAAAGRLLLLGGAATRAPTRILGDSWTWDGRAWAQRSSLTPVARRQAHLAYDAAAKHVVLFGGQDSNLLGDTWTWDGKGWTERTGPGPSARDRLGLVYDEAARHVLLFGGTEQAAGPFGGDTYLGDTWTWDGARWAQRAGAGPPARADAQMVYDEARRQVVLFGGYTVDSGAGGSGLDTQDAYLGDTWTWDGTRWTQRPGPGPAPRSEGHLVYDAATRQVVLYGGYQYTDKAVYYADTWTWDGTRWTKAGGAAPTARVGGGMAYDPASRQVVLFGGTYFAESFHYLNDTWTWDGRRWTRRTGTGPTPRAHVAMVADPATKHVLLFGGEGDPKVGNRYLGDTWTWDGRGWSVRTGIGPPERAGGATAYDAARGEAVLFGGMGDDGDVGETWRW